VLKDRLYTKAARSKSRRSAQTAVWKITSALVRLATPVLVFTAEEIWKYLRKAQDEPESIHTSLFPDEQGLRTGINAEQVAAWDLLSRVRSEVLKALEVARNERSRSMRSWNSKPSSSITFRFSRACSSFLRWTS
jgi:isoleucyl-tRNA synthetase